MRTLEERGEHGQQPIKLRRYFTQASRGQSVDRNGPFIYVFKDDVSEWISDFNVTRPEPWSHFDEYQSIVLLGPPRIGKSTEFKHQKKKSENGFLLPLRDLELRLSKPFISAIEEPNRWIAFLAGDESGDLFIDALDEGKLKADTTIMLLIEWLKSFDPNIIKRLRIHLSCRTQEWSERDRDKWLSLFSGSGEPLEDEPKAAVVEIEMLDLDREEYNIYCKRKGVDPKQLLEAVPQRAHHLLIRPQTLAMVVEEFNSGEKIVEDLGALYERAIERRLGEHNRQHAEHLRRQFELVPVRAKRAIAEDLAAATLMCGRDNISVEDAPPANTIPIGLMGHNVNTERLVLDSNLFQVYSESLRRFNEPEIADYLAASRLHKAIEEQTLSTDAVWRVLAGSAGNYQIVPRLRGMSVWLSAINAKFRRHAIQKNPGLLLYDYTGKLTSNDKVKIWNWLVQNYADRN